MKTQKNIVIGSSVFAAAVLAVGMFVSTPTNSPTATEPTPTPEAPITVEFGDNFTSATLTAIALHESAISVLESEIATRRAKVKTHKAALASLNRALEFQADPVTGFGYDILTEEQ